jgi:bacterioferritin
MEGDKQVIQHLNAALKNELTAINQYFLHSRLLKSWGLNQLGDIAYKESIEEMQHADKLIDRILQLGGLPNLQDLGKLLIGQTTKETLECDLKLEYHAIPLLKEAIAHAESVKDFASRDLFLSILNDEEGHVDWIETQLELIERVGVAQYEASKL